MILEYRCVKVRLCAARDAHTADACKSSGSESYVVAAISRFITESSPQQLMFAPEKCKPLTCPSIQHSDLIFFLLEFLTGHSLAPQYGTHIQPRYSTSLSTSSPYHIWENQPTHINPPSSSMATIAQFLAILHVDDKAACSLHSSRPSCPCLLSELLS